MRELPHRHLMTLKLQVAPAAAAVIGKLSKGYRTIVPVISGTFAGERLSGLVLNGADWVLTQSTGRMEIDVRLNLRTDQEVPLYLSYQGRFVGEDGTLSRLAQGESIPEDEFSLAMVAKFECGAPNFGWLNDVIAVGTGSQSGFNPTYEIFEVG